MCVLFILLSCCAALASSQIDSRDAAILKDTRYLSGDGTFGAAYSQDDGVEFKEESDEYGNRRGSYSYIDPEGQRRTVTYTAGVNGFQASGDHIPAQPAPTPPQPEYVPLAQYNPPDYVPPAQLQRVAAAPPPTAPAPQPLQRPLRYQLVRRPYQPQYETQETNYESQTDQRYYAPAPVRAPTPIRYRTAVPTAPPAPPPTPPPLQSELLQYQPSYAEYRADYPAVGVRYESKYEAPIHPILTYRPAIRSASVPIPIRYRYNDLTTPAPRKFYPPGKLDFNRTPDGFHYTFSKS